MPFECLLLCQDRAVFCTVEGILRDFSIRTKVCLNSSDVAGLLAEGSSELIVIDLEDEHSPELMDQIFETRTQRRPTIIAVSAVDCAIPGVDVVLRKPMTVESASQSIKSAYSMMVQDYRKHTRFAVMTRVMATVENHRPLAVTLTNIVGGWRRIYHPRETPSRLPFVFPHVSAGNEPLDFPSSASSLDSAVRCHRF